MTLREPWRSQEHDRGRRARLFSSLAAAAVLAIGLLPAVPSRSANSAALPIEPFVRALYALESQQAQKVRVLHFGDSHIASDTESSVVRFYLQSIFGDGGPGLGLPGTIPRYNPRSDLASGTTFGWRRYQPSFSSSVEDTGLRLSYIEAQTPGQRAWVEATGTEFRVYFLRQPEGGTAQFLLDGAAVGQIRMIARTREADMMRFRAPGPDAPHRFEIRTQDSGKIRILGIAAEKAAPGIIYSPLGLAGARADFLLKCREETFAIQVAGEQPDLIMLGYGTNESNDWYFDPNAYTAALTAIVSRMHRAAPSALVVLLTPPDRGDSDPARAQRIQGILQQVIRSQRAVARGTGAMLMDLHTAMGGPGSAEHWAIVQPPLAKADMTHFTNEGYDVLGRYIVGGILYLYGPRGNASDSQQSTGDMTPGKAIRGGASPGEFVPPLYPASDGASVLAARGRAGYRAGTSPAPAPTIYFLRADGRVLVTNDPSMIDTRNGRVISAELARTLLRRESRNPQNDPDR